MDEGTTSSSAELASVARRHAAAIMGGVSTKFGQPLEHLQLRQETCEAIDGKPGEYTVLVLAKNFTMYGVHLQLDPNGVLMTIACEEIPNTFTTDATA